MRRRPIFLLVALALGIPAAASCQCSKETSKETAPKPAETMVDQTLGLPNGMEVDLVAGPCGDAATVVVLLRVGIDHDPPGRSGMAHLNERLLATGAAEGRAARAVESGKDFTLYSVVTPGDHLTEELDEVARWMSGDGPTQADLERERANVLKELAGRDGTDAAAAARSFAEEAVRPTRGDGKRRGIASEVEAITLAELDGFWKSHVKPGNARVVVAGHFDAAKVRAHIEKAFGALPKGTPPAERDAADATVAGTLVMGDAPTAVAVAVPAPPAADALFAPFLVLSARLTEKPSQPRTWEASYDPLLRPDLLFIAGPVGEGEAPEPAAGRIRTEVAAVLAKPLSAAEPAAAHSAFRLLIEPRSTDPLLCQKDVRAFAVARARADQLAIDGTALGLALDAVTADQLGAAAERFGTKGSAAVIAGGSVR